MESKNIRIVKDANWIPDYKATNGEGFVIMNMKIARLRELEPDFFLLMLARSVCYYKGVFDFFMSGKILSNEELDLPLENFSIQVVAKEEETILNVYLVVYSCDVVTFPFAINNFDELRRLTPLGMKIFKEVMEKMPTGTSLRTFKLSKPLNEI